MRRRALLVLVSAALAASGCSDADGDLAVEAVHGFIDALERSDGPAACERLSEAGVSELLLTALEAGTSAEGLDAPRADRCAVIAERLTARTTDLAAVRDAPVTAVRVEGDRATVQTRAGAFEAEERDRRWLVAGFEPVRRAISGAAPTREPVHVAVVRPKLTEPALGPAVAGRIGDDTVELSGTLDPEGASLEVRAAPGTRVTKTEARDGRFRVRVALRHGHNDLALVARAAGRDSTERAVRLTRE